jgi:ribonuclease D
MFQTRISKQDINELPLMKYEGEIILIDSLNDLSKHIGDIKKEPFIGFDTEAKPAFKKGVYNPVALLQITTSQKTYLIRTNLIGLPKSITSIFEDPNIKKVGISIRDDIKDLQFLSHFVPQEVIELNQLLIELINIEQEGVRNLSAIILGGRISKSQQVSNWENEELTPQQKSYAATDAWVCHAIYDKLYKQGYMD